MTIIFAILPPFVDVEKHLPEMNAELERRRKEAVLARGGSSCTPKGARAN